MAKPLKIFLWTVGILLGLITTLAIALPLLIDPNAYREDIESAVQQKTGRELQIIGDIKLTVFPWLGVRMGAIELSNAQGFGTQPFARIDEVGVSVELLPLLDREVHLDTIVLRGLQLNLSRNASGTANWDDLIEISEQTPEAEPELDTADTRNEFALKSLKVAAIEIENAALRFEDQQAGTRHAIEQIALKTGALRRAEPINISLSFVVDSSQPAVRAEVDLVGQAIAELQDSNFELRKLSLNTRLSGEAVPNGQQQISLTGDLGYNKHSGTAKMTNGLLQAAGLNLALELDANSQDQETPKFAGRLNLKEFSPRSLMSALALEAPATADRNVLSRASVNARIQGDTRSVSIRDLDIALDDSRLKGSVNVEDISTQLTRFDLSLDQIDVDRYLPPKPEGNATESDSDDQSTDINSIAIPTEALDAINAAGKLTAAKLKATGLKFEEVVLTLDALKGKAKTQNLKAKFYGGQIDETVVITQRSQGGPQIRTHGALAAINAGPMLKDLLGDDTVSGLTNLRFDLKGQGNTVGELRQSLAGTLTASAENGAVKGFNLAEKIRSAKARLRGETLQAQATEQTDFATLTASAVISGGVLKSEDLSAKNPLLRLTGAGSVDLFNETLDYTAKPTIVETTKGQGGKDLDDLRGLTIPIRITGSWSDPKVKLGLEDALKEKAKARLKAEEDEAKEKLKQKLKDKEDEYKDKLRNKLGDFLKPKGG